MDCIKIPMDGICCDPSAWSGERGALFLNARPPVGAAS
jgi:hypothetical protein